MDHLPGVAATIAALAAFIKATADLIQVIRRNRDKDE